MTRFRLLLARAGLSVADLAKAVGVTRAAANGWANGSAMPRLAKVRAIAEALGCSVDEVLEALAADRSE